MAMFSINQDVLIDFPSSTWGCLSPCRWITLKRSGQLSRCFIVDRLTKNICDCHMSHFKKKKKKQKKILSLNKRGLRDLTKDCSCLDTKSPQYRKGIAEERLLGFSASPIVLASSQESLDLIVRGQQGRKRRFRFQVGLRTTDRPCLHPDSVQATIVQRGTMHGKTSENNAIECYLRLTCNGIVWADGKLSWRRKGTSLETGSHRGTARELENIVQWLQVLWEPSLDTHAWILVSPVACNIRYLNGKAAAGNSFASLEKSLIGKYERVVSTVLLTSEVIIVRVQR
ncbi:uncharacterized protein LOC143186662 [Calliopsis andreniformis]|uniref:uncharacterized protein LOC143186662 n=1 Tax=Calliopsis andreniformis TaxID=337506 RepID=UPI003FCE85C5